MICCRYYGTGRTQDYNQIVTVSKHSAFLKADGTTVARGSNKHGQGQFPLGKISLMFTD